MDNDDNGDRPTLPSLRNRQRPRVRPRPLERFDATTEHFFSNVETLPEIVVDPAFVAKMREATSSPVEEEVAQWWAAQRRSMHVRLVAVLLGASIALLCAGALR